MKKGVLTFISLLLVVVLALSGCSSSKEPAKTGAGEVKKEAPKQTAKEITVLSAPGDKIMPDVISAFEKETGIKVNYSEIAVSSLHSKLATLFGAKSSEADVVWTYSAWSAEFGNAGYLEPLDGKVSQELKNDLIPGSLEAVTYKNVMYGVPRFLSMRLFFYNKDAFKKAGLDPEKPPKTWDEFKQMAVKLTKDTDGDGKIDQYGYLGDYGAPNNNVMSFELLLYLNGGKMFDDQDQVLFNNDKGLKALTELADLHKLGVVDPSSIGISSGGDKAARFVTGKPAMTFGWFSTYASANDKEKSKIIGQLGWGTMPSILTNTASLGGSEGYAISKFSQKKEESLKFIEFVASKDVQKGIALRTGWMPVRKSIFNDPELKEKLPYTSVVEEQSKYPAYRFAAPYAQEVIDSLGNEILDAVKGTKDPKKALDDAAAKAKTIVAKYK